MSNLPKMIANTTLTGEETAVQFSTKREAFAVRNHGNNDLYISIEKGKSPGSSDTLLVPAGESAVYYHGVKTDTCYILGTAGDLVTIYAQTSKVNPFKINKKGGDQNIMGFSMVYVPIKNGQLITKTE